MATAGPARALRLLILLAVAPLLLRSEVQKSRASQQGSSKGYASLLKPCAGISTSGKCEELVNQSLGNIGEWDGASDVGARVGGVLASNNDAESGFPEECCATGTEYDAFISAQVPVERRSDFIGQVDSHTALIIVDVQNDFTTGSFGQPCWGTGGGSFVSGIADLIDAFAKKGALIIPSKDYHPADHCSFTPDHCHNTKDYNHNNFTAEQRYVNHFPSHCSFEVVDGQRTRAQTAPETPFCKSFGSPSSDAYGGPTFCKDSNFVGAALHSTIQEAIDALDPSQYEMVFKGFHRDYDSFSAMPHLTSSGSVNVGEKEKVATGSYALARTTARGCHRKWDASECFPSLQDLEDVDAESYNGGMRSILSILQYRDITKLIVVGLVFDFCVGETAAFAAEAATLGHWPGTSVFILADFSRPSFDGKPGGPYTRQICDGGARGDFCMAGAGTVPAHETWAKYMRESGVKLLRVAPDDADLMHCGPQGTSLLNEPDSGFPKIALLLAAVVAALALALCYVRFKKADQGSEHGGRGGETELGRVGLSSLS